MFSERKDMVYKIKKIKNTTFNSIYFDNLKLICTFAAIKNLNKL